MPMQNFSPNRFGQFLFMLGLLLLVAFFATDHIRDPQFCLFFWGAGSLSLGGFLIWRNRKPAVQAAERFRTVRKVSKNISFWQKARKEKSEQKKNTMRKP